MKFGANTFIWAESFGPEQYPLLPRVKAAGLDGVEIPIVDPAAIQPAAIRRELEKHGLGVTVCSVLPRGLSFTSADAATRGKSIRHFQDCIKAAAELGAGLIAGPLYSPVGYFTGRRRTAEEWKMAVESWRELAPALQDANMQIGLEPLNRFETYFLNTTADAARLCDEIGDPRVGILFDTFHANIEEKSVGPALRAAGRHLKHLHTCENDRGIPGTGNVNWPEFFETVRAIGYDGWMTIESFGFSLGELAAAASIWRDLAPEPETIAFEGVKFLRKNTGAKQAATS